MATPPMLSPDEPLRIEALRKLNIVETPLEERFERITRLACRTLKVSVAAVSLVEASRQWFKSAQGHNLCETSRDVSFCGHTILQEDLFQVPDARLDSRFADNPLVTGPMQCVFYAGCPLKAVDGSNIGAFCICDSKPHELSAEDIQTLRDLTALAEGELRSNTTIATLAHSVSVEYRRALIDSLTRMWNREGIFKIANNTLERSRAGASGLALIMVDLDHFKQINDRFGHAAGDEVLRVCARRMLSGIRETDAVGRVGGDEFLLLLPECDSETTALRIAERVRSHLTTSPVQNHEAVIPVTASLGVRYVPPETADSIEQIMERADHALYDAKHLGRDKIASSKEEDLVPRIPGRASEATRDGNCESSVGTSGGSATSASSNEAA